ncbi:uncharacterized protein LOC118437419 [Folsomia candida]|uniref:uncharacterized protein LOC118437419 n=1 Tax=Folsomia candida TaxID=158441 RepID=UPI0016052632|nr:uncharacterized protein LOC118437419 [Folsomia candida]
MVAHLWRKVRQCHLPSAEFHLHQRILRRAYSPVDLDKVPALEAGMGQLFEEMSLYDDNVEEDTSFLRKKLRHQKISQQLDKELTPKAIMQPSSSSNLCCCVDSQENVAPGKESTPKSDADKSIQPGNIETASTSKSPPSDGVQQPSNNLAANAPKNKSDYYFRLFLTNPGEYIRQNPTLFPPSDAAWSARKLLPDQATKSNPVDDDDPISEVAQTPADCTETLLSVDFTPDEYIAQLKASNYYAHGVRIVDGERRLVVYHKMVNPSGIKKEPI